VLGVHKLAASMHERLHLLARGANRHAPQRQQTLRAALEWSHALLDDAERAVFRRLAVVAGSADLELVMQVVVDAPGGRDLDEWAALDALSALVERSLVAVAPGPADTTRYRLLDSPRALAREKLAEAGEADALHERHARAVGQRFATADGDRWAGHVSEIEWCDRALPDIDNAQQALTWAEAHANAELALCIAPAMFTLMRDSASQAELDALVDRCATLAFAVQPGARACRALAASGNRENKSRRVLPLVERALAMARDVAAQDARLLYRVLCEWCTVLSKARRLAEAASALDEARALEQPGWPAALRGRRWEGEYRLALARGDNQAALDAQQQSLHLTRTAGGNTSVSLANLIDTQLLAGRANDAVLSGRALIAELEGTRFENPLAYARLNLAAALLVQGETAEARAIAQAGWPQAARFDMQPYWADHLALLAALEDRALDAARLAGYADAAYARNEDERQGNETAAVERARTLAREALGEAEAARLQAEGERCSDDDAAALAFGRPR
jgi:hypothetical protein